MPRTCISRAAGIAGAMILATGLAPLGAQADECSGLLCVFASKPAAPAPSPPAAQPVQPVTTAEAQPAGETSVPKARPKPKPRPVPVVTISAGPTEVPRLKALAAIVPKTHVRIIEAKATDAVADFAVTSSLDQPRGIETAKLFAEEMHVVAGAKIHSMADLRGKVVSFGSGESASQAAARKAFAALDIKVAETPLELDNALDGLATGDIDAVVVLAPQPDQRLRKFKASGLHLVAWPQDATLPDGAVAASIDVGAYPGLGKPGDKVAALGVDAVLTLNPKGPRQQAARSFLGALSQHSAALSKRGFDLLKADLDARAGRRVANAEQR